VRSLVLGGSGMLGQAVVAEGRRRGIAVLGLPKALADLERPDTLEHWLREFHPEVVFNCAAFTRVDDCEAEKERAMAINGTGVARLAEVATAAGARLVQVSTDYVFDGDGSRPYSVDAPTAPRSVYGESKLAGERAALAAPRALVVRTSWLFGPGGPNFVRAILGQVDKRRAAGDRSPLRVVADQSGLPTYTPFLARGLWDLAASGESGVFHYANRDATTWHGFASEIVAASMPELAVQPVTTAEFPRPARRPAYSVLDTSRFEAVTGRVVEPWRWGLAEYLDRNLQNHRSSRRSTA
jgi:dTDP-4-dehydrorhamnose reductase